MTDFELAVSAFKDAGVSADSLGDVEILIVVVEVLVDLDDAL